MGYWAEHMLAGLAKYSSKHQIPSPPLQKHLKGSDRKITHGPISPLTQLHMDIAGFLGYTSIPNLQETTLVSYFQNN